MTIEAGEIIEPCGAVLRRRRILDAAQEAFRVHGFHAAAMSTVAANARMSVGQIYRHFESKEAIVSAIIEESIEEFVKDLTRVPDASESLSERVLGNLLESLGRHADRGFLSFFHEVRAEAARHPKLQAILDDKDARIRDSLKVLMRQALASAVPAPAPGAASEEAAPTQEIADRVERLCLLLEGAFMRYCGRPETCRSEIERLLRPLFAAAVAPT